MNKADQQIILKFMEVTIDKVSHSLAQIYALKDVLISKGVISELELKSYIHDAESLPTRLVGLKTLKEMLESYKNSK